MFKSGSKMCCEEDPSCCCICMETFQQPSGGLSCAQGHFICESDLASVSFAESIPVQNKFLLLTFLLTFIAFSINSTWRKMYSLLSASFERVNAPLSVLLPNVVRHMILSRYTKRCQRENVHVSLPS